MNDLQVFDNEKFGEVRVVMVDDEPWFAGKDIAEALGYSNASKAVSTHVDEEDRMSLMVDITDSRNGNVSQTTDSRNGNVSQTTDSRNGNVSPAQTKTTFINESGMYSLILSSKLPAAKEFKRWVTSEVLPSIRKTGSYEGQIQTEKIKMGTYIKIAEVLALYKTRDALFMTKAMLENAGIDFTDHSVERLPVGVATNVEPVKIENPLRPPVPVETAKDAIDFMEEYEPVPEHMVIRQKRDRTAAQLFSTRG